MQDYDGMKEKTYCLRRVANQMMFVGGWDGWWNV
jgi:hypothetical protein